ncbi:unnamed protein product [Owenia fusiformis]|uniref:Uncharacterized protein n=1 Tax=Owenia fusiformis TaxID=6347 RepID=A0A8J1U2U9_OWEFU|nr:unnamed protein product [Owenia fusiformis]
MHKYREEAVSALHKLRGDKYDIEPELLEMEANIMTQSKEKFKLSYLRKPSVYKPLVILVILMAFKQLCGMGALTYYALEIFDSTNFSKLHPAMIIGGVNVVGTIFSAMIIDKAGRRILLITSGSILTLSSGALGVYYYLHDNHDMDLTWLSLVGIIGFFIGFSTGWGGIPWILLGELFPLKVRSAASALSVFVNWVSAFILTKEYSTLEGFAHKYGAMWCFSGISLLGVIFIAVVLPETKGKSLEEIEEYFEQSNKPLARLDNKVTNEQTPTSIQTT